MGTQSAGISKMKSEIKNANQSTDTIHFELSTFNKLCVAQNLLKEMYSLKERFEENKNKMIGEIEQNCFKYYKNKLHSKEIYDFFESNDLEDHIDYKLINNSKNISEKGNINNYIYEFLFIIRNNNSLILELIENCDPKYYKDLSNFLSQFFLEDTSNCSFFQEELLLIIYLFFEKLIIKKLPMKLNSSNLKKDGDMYNNLLNNHFVYFFLNDLTKKPDIRNYFCSFLSDIINILEEYKEELSVETKNISKKYIYEEENKKSKNKNFSLSKTVIFKKHKTKENILGKSGKLFVKNNKKLKETIKQSINNVKKRISFSGTINNDERMSINKNLDINGLLEKEENLDNVLIDEVKIDSFFNKEDIAFTYICEKLNYFENIKEKTNTDYAMIEYLDILLNEITKDGEPVEIFSTILLKNELKLCKINNENEIIYNKTVEQIKANYNYITFFITNLIKKIKDNINLIPFSLKCIFKIIDELLNKKYTNLKKGVFNYQLIITKTRIFFGCMIIPMLTNPDYSGIFTDGIISKLTKENMSVIVTVLKTIVSGNLFLVESEGYTIFNKYIIETIPKIFDIIINLDTNCILPDFITNLINDIPEKINDQERNINYNYFNEKVDEKIQFQSICFSWKDLYVITNSIEKNNTLFINNFKTEKEKKLYDEVLFNNKRYLDQYQEDLKNKVINYHIYTKILYEEELESKINAIIKDNFDILFQGQVNDEALRIKKCLSEVLAYVNYLQQEDFVIFLKGTENSNIIKTTDIMKYFKYKKNNLYDEIPFEAKKFYEKKQTVKNQNDLLKIKQSLRKVGIMDEIRKTGGDFFLRRQSVIKKLSQIKEDLDFKEVIFPQIMTKALSELYYNPQKGKSQRIIFCISYIQEHINDLPKKYTENNFNQIFEDILKQPEILIKELQYNILNQFHLKIRNCEKLNLISSKDYFQINNMERFLYTGYLFNNVILKGSLKVNVSNNKIDSIELDFTCNKNNQPNFSTIQSFINEMPNFIKYESQENIIDLEKKLKVPDIINNYFKELKNTVKNQKIVSNFSTEEFLLITYELENYILLKLKDKLYPSKQSKEDKFFFKKCCRLDFVKPENIIKNKKMINEKLLDISISYVTEMDKKLTPVDKIKNFGKAIDILKNSMTFNSGKTDLGLDDTLPFIIYIVLKSKQTNIYTNLNYCNLFINPDLSKKQFGNMLTQLGMVIDIIKNMKHNELIGVTEQQFGKDEYNI